MGSKLYVCASRSEKSDFERLYIKGKVIGEGNFAKVYEVTRRHNKDVKLAAKMIWLGKTPTKQQKGYVKEETGILKSLNHRNLIEVYDIFETSKRVVFVMEYCKGGNLLDRLLKKKRYKEMEALNIMIQVAEAVNYMHDQNVVHRDLKPDNILFKTDDENSEIKITDFGLSKMLDNDKGKMYTACGTPNYAPPELILKKGYTNKCDVWSMGVVLYMLLSGALPFTTSRSDMQSLLKAIVYNDLSFSKKRFKHVSGKMKCILRSMLTKDPHSRPDSKETLDLLKHHKNTLIPNKLGQSTPQNDADVEGKPPPESGKPVASKLSLRSDHQEEGGQATVGVQHSPPYVDIDDADPFQIYMLESIYNGTGRECAR